MGLIILSPILLITSIAIKLDSQGPIFIRETLYGYSNRAIQALKFRVMTTCVEGNPRVTQIGQMVSQAGIDELPQLFNVLLGEMSIWRIGAGPGSRINRAPTHQRCLVYVNAFSDGVQRQRR